MGNRGSDVSTNFVGAFNKASAVVDVILRGLGDPGHCPDCFHRIGAAGSLTREHDGGGAVIDGIGNISCLGACRTGVVHHGIQHLGRCDDDLAAHFGEVDDVLLVDGWR